MEKYAIIAVTKITAYRGEVWSPVEILLRSAMDYANPYVETEIDATFTHTDGTVITIPGFWMGGNTWAVRFSPTKAGEWSYKITCSDKSNKGLSKTGTVTASKSSKTTGLSQHGFVTVEKGERYYKHADGTPFFWLGDTNWQAFSNVSTTVCNYPGCHCGSQFEHIVNDRVAEDRSLLVAYFYDAHRSAKIKVLDPAKTYDVYWFNPRTGKYIPVEKGLIAKDGSYTVSSRPDDNDWVLLITALGLADHYEEDLPKDLNPTYEQVAPTGTKVTPVSVKAVGGISYSGAQKDAQTMTDHTAWLWDGNPATVWKPVADRSTQTFIFDLGKAHKLTHVNITPAEGTIIPTFRVEGSNDGKIWTVITDTPIRDAKNPGAASEPLAGTYRYVKILLRNADTLHIGEDQLSSLPYKAMYNPATFNCYSVTEISDITIYSDGEGEPTPDRFVTDTPATDPEQGTDETTEPITDAPVEGTEAPTAEPPSEKKGCKSALSGMPLAAVAASGSVICARRRKED